MIEPILSKFDIKIVQIGIGKEFAFQRIINLLGQTNMHQLAYVMKRSLLHLGPDSFGVHLASSYDIPIVAAYSISMPEVAGPCFGSPERQTVFKGYKRVGNKKPSFSPQENPKSINTIKPEEMANAVFKLLKIDFSVPFETIYLGPRYSHQVIREILPNSPHVMPFPHMPIEIRWDLADDEKALIHHLNYWQKISLITDRPVKLELLRQYKTRLTYVAYHVRENDNPEFARQVTELGIPLILVSRLLPEALQIKKINYYDFATINPLSEPDAKIIAEVQANPEKMFYHSCKITSSNGQLFNSHSDMENNIPMLNDFEYHRVVDRPSFWQDLDFCTIVKKL